ncbi:type I-B CRISPR-associated endonuclease Cas1b [Fulvivirga sediminis]|uniref:CRISPR-associated endonuclease Cas1 n=1 Tax=Fulvivirga sediminis TaxID=2803949 RepID=A0A937K0S3_9BACT|nr:type I-B CRISPR-associated endonuclease Cas1b [Fulvivirga sediminis]MBL3656666.1 type I-B CRISPR-associated endonuclease Cas1 [Fulvivirga sediminis]
MKKTYYLFNPGRLSRKDNTLKFTPVDDNGKELMPKYIPVENVSDLYLYGSLDANSALYNFLGKSRINVHFFDYYEHYTGSFYAKEYLQAGKLQVEQTRHYLSNKKRLEIARPLIKGAAHNMLRNLKYYQNRGKNTTPTIDTIEQWISDIDQSQAIDQLMGIEGNIRQCYYIGIDEILKDLKMEGRSKQPPKNEVNSLISFGNMICYTICLDQIYHTQLNPTISFLHEPGARRFSLALDIAEIFKPLLVDRVIFSLLNKQQLKADDFHDGTGRITLKEKGKKVFLKAWEDRLNQTIKHRSLGRHVSYKHLIKLECYKLCNHLIGAKEYQPFKAWW